MLQEQQKGKREMTKEKKQMLEVISALLADEKTITQQEYLRFLELLRRE